MKEDRLDQLLHDLFEERLGEDGRVELNALLSADPQARTRYRRSAALHAALARKASAPGFFESTAVASPTAPRRGWIAAAAVVALLGTAAALFAGRPRGPVATVLQTGGVAWADGSAAPESGRLPVAVPLELTRGFIRLGFPSGAEVTLEGPCRFRLDQKEALSLLHGRASVHTPDGAEGFHIDTPGGRFVDLGTEFGLAVGNDGTTPVVLTEVFKGEVEVQPSPQESTRLKVGESRALIRDEGRPRLLAALDESPVTLVNHHARELPRSSGEDGNLALGKPVFSPGYCTRPHGSVFPPDNLTDGRLDDSGVPGDWSFWLAPDGDSGEFTVDLLKAEKIGRISLQNTSNRGIDDRGTAEFEAFGSLDNKSFFPLVSGSLPRVAEEHGQAFPFHDFRFTPVEARYVKVVVTRHYRHLTRPAGDPHHGGGMNEIRIFP